jgi:hypothetical protein
MSKGSSRRPTDQDKYNENWEKIFGNKKKPEQYNITGGGMNKERELLSKSKFIWLGRGYAAHADNLDDTLVINGIVYIKKQNPLSAEEILKREPLSEVTVLRLFTEAFCCQGNINTNFARAIEKAHGITGVDDA